MGASTQFVPVTSSASSSAFAAHHEVVTAPSPLPPRNILALREAPLAPGPVNGHRVRPRPTGLCEKVLCGEGNTAGGARSSRRLVEAPPGGGVDEA